jgi:hypothetical protein
LKKGSETVASAEVRADDRESLLNLWENARLEHDAAGHLLLADGRGLRRSVALHVLRGWHALATIRARQSGLPDPEFESFTIDRESQLLAPIATRRLSSWDESFDTIREVALARSWRAEAHEADKQLLSFQVRLLGDSVAAQRHEVTAFAARSWTRLFGTRPVLTAAAVLVIILAAIGLERRLARDAEPAVDHDSIEQPVHETVVADVSQLRNFKPTGSKWDETENVLFGNRLIIPLDGTRHPDIISVSLDGNDRYSLRLMAGDEQVGHLDVGPSPTEGLEVYMVTVPEEAFARGFDSIEIEVLDGDGSHSLGHLLLNEPNEGEKP